VNAKLLRADGNGVAPSAIAQRQPTAVENAHLPHLRRQGSLSNYFTEKRVVRFDFANGAGHPVGRHPVSDVHDPADPSKIKWPLGCLSCHQPHAGGARAMLVKDQTASLQFCRNCHDQNFGAE
jgi:predicted CXXCH cytochrome family protein